jgi:hypothetical protein
MSEDKNLREANLSKSKYSLSTNIYNSAVENLASNELGESQEQVNLICELQQENIWLKNELANKDILIEKFKQSEHQANLFLSILKKLLFKNNVWERDYFQFVKVFEFAIDYCKSFKFFYIESREKVDKIDSNEIVYKLMQLLEKVNKGYFALKNINGKPDDSERHRSISNKKVKVLNNKSKQRGVKKKVKYLKHGNFKTNTFARNSRRSMNLQKKKLSKAKAVKIKKPFKKVINTANIKNNVPRETKKNQITPIKKMVSFEKLKNGNINTFTFQKLDNNLMETPNVLVDDSEMEVMTSVNLNNNFYREKNLELKPKFKQLKISKSRNLQEKENKFLNKKKYAFHKKHISDFEVNHKPILKKKHSNNKVLFSERNSVLRNLKYENQTINNSMDFIKQKFLKTKGYTPQFNKSIIPKSNKRSKLCTSQYSTGPAKNFMNFSKKNPYPYIVKKSVHRTRKSSNAHSMFNNNIFN